MKSNITSTITQQPKEKPAVKEKADSHPSARTLAFLKAFARNYQVELSMPEGLQGIIIG